MFIDFRPRISYHRKDVSSQGRSVCKILQQGPNARARRGTQLYLAAEPAQDDRSMGHTARCWLYEASDWPAAGPTHALRQGYRRPFDVQRPHRPLPRPMLNKLPPRIWARPDIGPSPGEFSIGRSTSGTVNISHVLTNACPLPCLLHTGSKFLLEAAWTVS